MLMRQMRQNTKIIMLVTALAFVALMIFEWGMDMSGRSGSGGALGNVGGTTVSVQQYQDAYRSLYSQIQSTQSEPITAQQNREIEDLAWNQVVNQILITEELARRGIRVSDDEIRQAARMSPPPEFQTDPAFLNAEGLFDLTLYQQFLNQAAQDPLFLQQLEQYYRELLPRNKLMRQVTAGIFVSDQELWQQWRALQETAEVTFIAVSPEDRIPDQDVGVTPADVEAYYAEHEEEFEVPARAQVRYTYLLKAPTAADTAAALELTTSLREEIVGGGSFEEIARRESMDLGSAQIGGALGAFGPGALPPTLDEAAFSLPVGELSEPIESVGGYHLLEVTSRDEETEIVEARHIMIPIDRTDESEVSLLTRADSLETVSEERTLEEAAAAFGLEVLTGEITEGFASLPRVGTASDAQFWIFSDDEGLGATSPLYENADAFYLVELIDVAPAGMLSLDEVSSEIETQLRTARKSELLLEEGGSWAERVRSGAVTIEGLAEELNTEVQTSAPFTRQEFVPGLGQTNAAVGLAFGVPLGEIGGPVVAQGRVVILRVDNRIEADPDAWETQKESPRSRLMSEMQQLRLDEWLDGMRQATRIVDNRAAYFQAAEEQAVQGVQAPTLY